MAYLIQGLMLFKDDDYFIHNPKDPFLSPFSSFYLGLDLDF
jgi:hypothetical protein